eukprot:Protomagalhaensia_wolfi_Nauph_80__1765@NODE_209_length_3171_cov_19_960089_g157_i0_p4_GENE_NODE_209_length_3171_cov_19_960089_g157_i0NODE_209_length_3171_cov_19_960089_g157_i0_p4_ORF_typecomplete_len108_score13_76Senescence_reg/PF04520_13/0_034_NODE_209_length_3171_cov_19_960089_g157_i014701793
MKKISLLQRLKAKQRAAASTCEVTLETSNSTVSSVTASYESNPVAVPSPDVIGRSRRRRTTTAFSPPVMSEGTTNFLPPNVVNFKRFAKPLHQLPKKKNTVYNGTVL